MGTKSCHSNQSSYPTGIKKHNFSFPLPKDAVCVIWKESASRFQRRCRLKMLTDDGRTDDGRTPDACIYYKLKIIKKTTFGILQFNVGALKPEVR